MVSLNLYVCLRGKKSTDWEYTLKKHNTHTHTHTDWEYILKKHNTHTHTHARMHAQITLLPARKKLFDTESWMSTDSLCQVVFLNLLK